MFTQAYRIAYRLNTGRSPVSCSLSAHVRAIVSELGLRRRGCRSGAHVQQRFRQQQLVTGSAQASISRAAHPWEIPTIIGNRLINNNNNNKLSLGLRCERRAVVTRIHLRGPQDNMRLGLFNARSVSNKSACIQQWVVDKKLNAAGLVETWHDDASSPDLIACAPPGFKFIERARPRKKEQSMSTNHGGVCLLYDTSLHARPLQLPFSSTFEAVAAYVHRAGFNAVVVVLYRPGSCSVTNAFFDDFSDLLERLSTYSAPLMILGDFNIHMDDVVDLHAGKLLDILANHSLHQHVNSSTHRQGHILDLIITREIQHLQVLPIDPPMLSDHSPVVADCACQPSSVGEPTFRQVRNWRNLDVNTFATDLENSDMSVSPSGDVNTAFRQYDSTLASLLDKHAPLKLQRVNSRRSDRWYDRECRSTKRTTRRLERKYRRLLTDESLAAWRSQFQLQRLQFQSKFISFWSSTISSFERNPRALWRAVNGILQPPQQQRSLNLSANDFATFFQDKVAGIRASTAYASPPVIIHRQAPSFYSFTPVTVPEVVRLLKVAPAKSCALDPIPTWLLKQVASSIAPVICHLCNLSMQTGTFPTPLKQARVLPLLKKHSLDPDTASSYRPISNLSYLSKIIERVVAQRFSSHISSSHLLPVQQSAYRPFHSTETAVLSVHNDLVCAVDKGQVSLLMLLDLSAAFDTVDHSILLSILSRRFSVTDTALSWFNSYLSDRTQSFVYAGQQTSCFPVYCSVPQGSVLGPVEFTVYTEDITELLIRHETRSHLYADDTQLYASCRPEDMEAVITRMSNCVADVAVWCASRRLQLNADKTEVIWFGSRANLAKIKARDCSVRVGSESIKPSNAVRDLGVYLDEELTMKQHIAKVAAACFYHLRRIRQIRRRVGKEVATQLVLAFVTSRLDYCNSVLAGLPQVTLEPLQRVQNAAVRLILDLNLRDHVTPGLRQLHWLPVRWRVQHKLCTIMQSIHTGRCPVYMTKCVQSEANKTTRTGLRSSNSSLYVTPRLRTRFGERAFSFAGPAAWNSLPAELRDSNNVLTFRSHLKTHFFNLAFT
jgi:Reverse transcriptase (RNA-dependent DNA polymerase)/Endonuclease-reverse transcriptase